MRKIKSLSLNQAKKHLSAEKAPKTLVPEEKDRIEAGPVLAALGGGTGLSTL